jgi:hypothetical protein
MRVSPPYGRPYTLSFCSHPLRGCDGTHRATCYPRISHIAWSSPPSPDCSEIHESARWPPQIAPSERRAFPLPCPGTRTSFGQGCGRRQLFLKSGECHNVSLSVRRDFPIADFLDLTVVVVQTDVDEILPLLEGGRPSISKRITVTKPNPVQPLGDAFEIVFRHGRVIGRELGQHVVIAWQAD